MIITGITPKELVDLGSEWDVKAEYDPAQDPFYLWLQPPGTTAATPETISPGVHADFD